MVHWARLIACKQRQPEQPVSGDAQVTWDPEDLKQAWRKLQERTGELEHLRQITDFIY